jgi:dihydroxyacetone kinase DhaKLM complex PTS-EIIA-like component DhaM
MQQSFVPHGLTSADLERHNRQMATLKNEMKDDDAMTEFSACTDETEIGPVENLLELRISTANLEKSMLVQFLGKGKDITSAKIQTFLAVDFYNHDTKTTDMATSESPIYNTLFSFKNTVDDFYLRHLQTDTILVDVFMSLDNQTIKIGSARLPLNKLIEKDYSFQA